MDSVNDNERKFIGSGKVYKLSERTQISDIYKDSEKYIDREVAVAGWIRTIRQQGGGNFAFVELSDGICFESLQVVCSKDQCGVDKFNELCEKCGTGASVFFTGQLIKSSGSRQAIELQATFIEILGGVNAQNYPLAKKKHTLEHMREYLHLRPRSRTFGAVARVRSALAYATHDFFIKNDFIYCNTPILTSSDCEGAGEMFQVTTLLQGADDCVSKIPRLEDGKCNYSQDFFKRPTFLAVSGQLNVESYACSLSKVYTFGPTFRAEKSKTTRHLAEFWMIEPEIAFADLEENMDIAENYIKHTVKYVMENCKSDLEFFENFEIENNKKMELESKKAKSEAKKGKNNANKNNVKSVDVSENKDTTKINGNSSSSESTTKTSTLSTSCWNMKKLRDRLENTINSPFERISYTKAIEILKEAQTQFEDNVDWGIDLSSEMERYLCEVVYKKPIILYNYPRDIKSFYMRLNDDNKTVAAMDVLVPGIGELVGGSQREERIEVLEQSIERSGLKKEDYEFYMDLRRYGTVPHSGFGLGFERLVRYASGLENIKDTCMFPRAFATPLEG